MSKVLIIVGMMFNVNGVDKTITKNAEFYSNKVCEIAMKEFISGTKNSIYDMLSYHPEIKLMKVTYKGKCD